MNKEELRDMIIDLDLSENTKIRLLDKVDLVGEDLYEYISKLEKENEELKYLCDEYEKEHSTVFKEWSTNILEIRKKRMYYENSMRIINNMILDLKKLGDSNES